MTNVVVKTVFTIRLSFFSNINVLQKYGSKQNSKVCFYLTINIKSKTFLKSPKCLLKSKKSVITFINSH